MLVRDVGEAAYLLVPGLFRGSMNARYQFAVNFDQFNSHFRSNRAPEFGCVNVLE